MAAPHGQGQRRANLLESSDPHCTRAHAPTQDLWFPAISELGVAPPQHLVYQIGFGWTVGPRSSREHAGGAVAESAPAPPTVRQIPIASLLVQLEVNVADLGQIKLAQLIIEPGVEVTLVKGDGRGDQGLRAGASGRGRQSLLDGAV